MTQQIPAERRGGHPFCPRPADSVLKMKWSAVLHWDDLAKELGSSESKSVPPFRRGRWLAARGSSGSP